ncbi:MAG: SMP-30/gluconolactonase/LRE family protein [Acidobacteriota bacterium]|nr:SMP-30/gluconolactonase/LRE family protein [Acidobacteriota bacterium]
MTKARQISLFLTALIGLIVLYLLFWPIPISPQAWTPPVAPPLDPKLGGQYQQNSRLTGVERLSIVEGGTGFAPEDVALDNQGRIYAGIDDGRIMRLEADGTHPEVFSNTHGRPLGLVFDLTGNLIVADAIKGLLSVGRDGSVAVLTTEADGVPFGCPNDLDVAADGTIYFTDASTRFPLSNYVADLIEHLGTGRLLSFDPKTRTTRTLLKDLCFANGVAVSPDQSFVLVVETGSYRVYRLWLSGPAKHGQAEIFIDNLPGFPDGISSNGRDKFWLALVNPRDEALDKLGPHPFLRKMVFRLPRFLQPAPKRYGFVLGLDLNGHVVENLQDGSQECYARVANVIERQGALYLGSIGESAVGRYRLPSPIEPSR